MRAALRSAAIAVALLLAAPVAASAACTPRDIVGGWRIVIDGERCSIRIRPSGLFSASPCFNAGGRKVATMTGRLHVDRACRVGGSAILKVGRRAARLLIGGRMNATHDLISGELRRGAARVGFIAYAR